VVPLGFKSHLSLVVVLTILGLWLIFLRPTILYGNTSYIIVNGRSMEPTLRQGDLIILKPSGGYEVGDIVGYVSPHGPIVVHRIVGREGDAFILKGDNHDMVDPWPITQDMILGRLIVRIPYLGHVFGFLKNPVWTATAVSLLFFLALVSASKTVRRRGSRLASVSPHFGVGRACLLGALATLLALSVYAAYSLHQLPVERVEFVELYQCVHTGTFHYQVRVKPSVLYGNRSVIGPGETIYVSLARVIDVAFRYGLNSTLPCSVSGRYSAYMDVELPEEWRRRFALAADVPFGSDGFTFHHSLNVTEVQGLISRIEREIGMEALSYNVWVALDIQVSGVVGGYPIQDRFEPRLKITLTKSKIHFEGLEHTKPLVGREMRTVPNTLRLLGLPIHILHLRYLSYAAIAITASTLTVSAVVSHRGKGPEDPAQEIMRRYGRLLIRAAEPPKTAGRPVTTVRLETFQDLLKVAQETGKLIIYQKTKPKAPGEKAIHTYYVLDGTTQYTYQLETQETKT